MLNGIGASDVSGRSVTSAGDINGDGIPELAVSELDGFTEIFILSGAQMLQVADNTEFDEVSLARLYPQSSLGYQNPLGAASFSMLEDHTGDGLADLIIGTNGRFG